MLFQPLSAQEETPSVMIPRSEL